MNRVFEQWMVLITVVVFGACAFHPPSSSSPTADATTGLPAGVLLSPSPVLAGC
jgi:hypothetical protein